MPRMRVLDGAPLYDLSVNVAGAFAIFLYPPPFGLAFTPFALVSREISLWQWEAVLVASLVTAIAILPVQPRVRWILLVASVISWPVALFDPARPGRDDPAAAVRDRLALA